MPGISPGIQEAAQFTDVTRRVAVFQAKMGQTSFCPSLGGPRQKFIKVLLAHAEDRGLLGFIGHGCLQKEKARSGVSQAGNRGKWNQAATT